MYSKTCLKRPLKKKTKKNSFQDRLSLNAGLKLQNAQKAYKLPFVFKTFVLSIFNDRLKQILLYLLNFFGAWLATSIRLEIEGLLVRDSSSVE